MVSTKVQYTILMWQVPEAIKDAYRNPVALLPALPPAHLRPPPQPILPPEFEASLALERLKTHGTPTRCHNSSSRESPSSVVHKSRSTMVARAPLVVTKEECSKEFSNSVSVPVSLPTDPADDPSSSGAVSGIDTPASSAVSLMSTGHDCGTEHQSKINLSIKSSPTISESGKTAKIEDKSNITCKGKDESLTDSSQMSDDGDSQKDCSTDEEETQTADSRSACEDMSEKSDKTDSETSKDEDGILESTSSPRKDTLREDCVLKECDEKNRKTDLECSESVKCSEGRLIQSNGDMNEEKWNSLLDEPFENNNKIVSKSKTKIDENNICTDSSSDSSDNSLCTSNDKHDHETLKSRSLLDGEEEMEVSSTPMSPSNVSNNKSSSRLMEMPKSSVPSGIFVSSSDVEEENSALFSPRELKSSMASSNNLKISPSNSSSGIEVNSMLSSADALLKSSVSVCASMASPNPDWPSPIMDISDDSCASERPVLEAMDCDAGKQRLDISDDHASNSKSVSLPYAKSIIGSPKHIINNHVVTSQFSNTFNTYSKSYQVLNSCPSKLVNPINAREELSIPNNYLKSIPKETSSSLSCTIPKDPSNDCQSSLLPKNLPKITATSSVHMSPSPLAVSQASDSPQVVSAVKPTKQEYDVVSIDVIVNLSSVHYTPNSYIVSAASYTMFLFMINA